MSFATRLSRLWNNPGPDSGWSWVILAAGWLFMILTFGICRSGTAGVMLVEFLAVFDANRREAMWPFSVLGMVECIGGLLSGAIAESFDGRMVLMVCAVSCTLGMVLCFWAQNLTWIALFFGVFMGLGESISLTVTWKYFSHFFEKHLGTANGVYMTATPIGGFVMPVIMNALISRYGLRGAMLLVGGMAMQLLIAAALLRPRTSKYFPCLVENKKDVLLLPIQEPTEDKENVEIKKFLMGKQVHNLLSDQEPNEDKEDFADKVDSIEEQAYKLLQKPTEDNKEFVKNEIYLEQTQGLVSTPKLQEDKQELTRMQLTLVKQASKKRFDDEVHRTYQQSQDNVEELNTSTLRQRIRYAISLYKTVLCIPMFYVVTVQSVASINILVGFALVSVDFVMDSGGSKNDGVLIVIAFSIASLTGRLLCGFISDRQYVKDSTASLVAMFVLTICLAMIGNMKDFYAYIALAICMGLAEGFTTTLINILYKIYVGHKGLATSIGLRLFTNGVFAFFRPMIAGYFRNSSGSYTNFYYFLGSLTLTSGVLWLFEPIFMKTNEIRKLEITEL